MANGCTSHSTVNPSESRLFKKTGGEALVWKVSSGRSGFETLTGVFNVQRMDAEHFSDKYERAPMPYMIFFSRGLAISRRSSRQKIELFNNIGRK
jgi:hypothetical protein